MRDGSIELYCECIIEYATNNMNLVQNMENVVDNITVGSVARANSLAPLEADKDAQHLNAYECSYHSGDYDVSTSSKEDEFE